MLREEFHRPGGARGEGGHAIIDELAEQEIYRLLITAFPAYGYRGEELGFKASPKDSGRHTWVVDPNDGTSDFLRGFRGSSVAIGLLHAGRPVLGVVYAYCAPDSAGDLIAWAEGCGPVLRNGVPVQRAWPDRATEESVVLVSTYSDLKAEVNARTVAPMRFRATPSIAYRLAVIAVGDADATVSLNAPNSWDYAAGHALLIGAGANLADAAGRAVTYTADGYSDCGGECYGGPEPLIWDLIDHDWRGVKRGARDRSTPFVRPARGHAIRDPGLLSRAQGAMIGLLATDAGKGAIEGQPDAAGEMALALARSMIHSRGYHQDPGRDTPGAMARAVPIGIAYDPAKAAKIADADGGRAAALLAAKISEAVRSGGSASDIRERAVFGASRGLRALPSRWTNRVLSARPIAGLMGVEHPRPPECWPIDALQIAEQLLLIG